MINAAESGDGIVITKSQRRFEIRNFKTQKWVSMVLRGYWSLELVFLDKKLANPGFEDIIQISQFIDLAFSLRQECLKTFLYAHTP